MNDTLEIEINQPRARVAELFGDPENLGAWQPGYLGLEHLSGTEGAAGSTSTLRYAHGKRVIEMTELLEVNNLPDEFSATYCAKGMKMTVRNRFEEAGPDKTRWDSENEAVVSGIMMRVIALIMPGCFRKQSLKYMENFKAFAEDGTDLRKE
jgi:carbon monoxide dehydrogenase subunit G